MNDLMPTLEENITPDVQAQIEHEEHERSQRLLLEQESWADLVAIHGPLMSDSEWKQYKSEYEIYLDTQWSGERLGSTRPDETESQSQLPNPLTKIPLALWLASGISYFSLIWSNYLFETNIYLNLYIIWSYFSL